MTSFGLRCGLCLYLLFCIHHGFAQEVKQTFEFQRQLGDPPTRVSFEPFDTTNGELVGVTFGFAGSIEMEILVQNFSTLELEANDWFYDAGANVILAFDEKDGFEDGGPFYGLGGIFTTGITGALSAGSGGTPFENPSPGEVDVAFSFSGNIDSEIRSDGALDYFISSAPITGQTQPFQDLVLTPPLDAGPDVFINASALQLFQEGTLSMTYEYVPRLGRPEDCNQDGQLTIDDLSCVCDEPSADLDTVLNALSLVKGDLDADGVVAFSDFLRLANAFGTEADYSSGDINCNGTVEFTDFLLLAENFGSLGPDGPPVGVPEPSATSLALLAAIAACHSIRRRVAKS